MNHRQPTYAAPGTPTQSQELASLYAGIADIRHNVKARAQSARAPHIQLPTHRTP